MYSLVRTSMKRERIYPPLLLRSVLYDSVPEEHFVEPKTTAKERASERSNRVERRDETRRISWYVEVADLLVRALRVEAESMFSQTNLI